ncbi:Ankyrin repeat domain-containing protein 17 [Hondaea fermentalgiana]|uniref:Ankyrin repeat domain-containing protein 17 n=1 Tax=Hondaea fermentalgiana TaxID=2315210 RepID=A0A2R5GGY6_9STRA|nr:Ankyrin repeat domain-containing protein 17 [Hondaea fermentalgiana]|eukprot:GBG27114.1 Ankyrin repeat domain-containing protein 17 [Hondaea fermentalgiana]
MGDSHDGRSIWPLHQRSQRSHDESEQNSEYSASDASQELKLVESESMDDVFRVEQRPSFENRLGLHGKNRPIRHVDEAALAMAARSPASFVFIGKDLRHSAARSSVYQISSGRRLMLDRARRLDSEVNSAAVSDSLVMQIKIVRYDPDEAYLVNMYEVDKECNISLNLRLVTRLKLEKGRHWGEATADLLRRSLRKISESDSLESMGSSESSAGGTSSPRPSSQHNKRLVEIEQEEEESKREDDQDYDQESGAFAMRSESDDDFLIEGELGLSEDIQIAIHPPTGKSNEIIVELGPAAVAALGSEHFIKCTFYCPRIERERHFVWQWTKDGHVASTLKHSVGFQMSSVAVALSQNNDDSATLRLAGRPTSLPSRAVPPSSTFIFDLDASATNGIIPVTVLRNMLLHRWFFPPRIVDKHILRDIPPDLEGIGPSWIERVNARLREHILEGDIDDVDEDTREAILILFPFACKVALETLGGGFSGAKVYRCVNTNWDGSQEIPSVVKVDDAESLEDEFRRMVEITPLLGENAPRILARATHKDLSALRIELCGATWCLPGAGEYNTHITTFRKLFKSELSRLAKIPTSTNAQASPVSRITRRRRDKVASTTELPHKHYPGAEYGSKISRQSSGDGSSCSNGSRRSLDISGNDSHAMGDCVPHPAIGRCRLVPRSVSETLVQRPGSAQRDPVVASRRLLMRQHSRSAVMQDSHMQTLVLKRSSTMSTESEVTRGTEDQSVVFGEIEAVVGEVFGTILRAGAIDMATVEQKSLFDKDGYPLAATVRRHVVEREHDATADLLLGPQARSLVQKWTGLERMDVREYFVHFLDVLQSYELDTTAPKQRLMGHVHGDLNGANILIDGESIVWLIDFAFSGMRPVLMDLVKLENTLLFEYTPLQTEASPEGIAVAEFAKVVEALVSSTISDLPPLVSLEPDYRAPGHLALDQLWSVLRRIRQHVVAFSEKDPRPEYLHAGRLYYALKTLSFRDLGVEQKRFALASALGHASRLAHLLAPGMLGPQRAVTEYTTADKTVIEAQVSAHFKSLQREQVKHLTMVGAKDALFVDPVSRSRLSVLKQCVNLEIAEHPLGRGDETESNTAKFSIMDVASKIDALLEAFSEAADELPIPGMVCPGDIPMLCAQDQVRLCYTLLSLRTPLEDALQITLEPFAALTTSMQYVPARDLSRRLVFSLVYLESKAFAEAKNTTSQVDGTTKETSAVALLGEATTSALPNVNEKLFLSPLWLRRAALTLFNEVDALHYGQYYSRLAELLPSQLRSHRSSLCLVPLRIRLIDIGRHVHELQLTADDDLIMLYLTHLYGAASTKLAYFRSILFSGRVLLLLDGFDEAGTSREVIVQYLSRFLQRSQDLRVIVTSRETGFVEFQDRFHAIGFKGLKMQPLSTAMTQDIVSRRLQDGEQDPLNLQLQRQIQAEEFRGIAHNPLMLSLLVHVLKSHNEASASSVRRLSGQLTPIESTKALPVAREGAPMLRSQLYALAVDQMLHHGDPKYKRHRSREDKAIGRDLGLLQDPLARSILCNVALLVHSRRYIEVGLDDFGAVVVALSTQGLGVEDEERARISKRLVTVNNGLQRSIQRNLVPLFELRESQTRNSARSRESQAFSRTLIFTHLSLQEHLAAECIAERLALCHGMNDTEGFLHVCSVYFGGHLLEDTWWHDVFLSTCEILSLSSEGALHHLLRALFVTEQVSRHMQATLIALKQVWMTTAKQGNVPALVGLLKQRADINASYVDPSLEGGEMFDLVFVVDQYQNTCLHHAAENNRLVYVDELGANVSFADISRLRSTSNFQSWKPSSTASCNNNLEMHRKLVRTPGDEDVDEEDPKTVPEIVKAIKAQDGDAACALLAENSTVFAASGSTGMTATMWACVMNMPEVLERLLEADKEREFMTVCSRKGNTCLAFAVEHNARECVGQLLARGMSPTWRSRNKDTLLLIATSFGFNEVAAQLIEFGAMSGEAIVVSALQGRDGFVQKLLEICGDDAAHLVNHVVNIGVNPLAAACVAGHQSTIALLLAMGADVNHPINVQMGTCALHVAMQKCNFECIDLLVSNGANVNLASPAESAAVPGQTALSLALSMSDPNAESNEFVSYLRTHGAKTWEEMTPQEQDENTRSWYAIFGPAK